MSGEETSLETRGRRPGGVVTWGILPLRRTEPCPVTLLDQSLPFPIWEITLRGLSLSGERGEKG